MRVRVDRRWESVAQRDGRRQHLDADEEVLVAGRHSTGGGGHAVRVHDRRYHLGLLEDGEGHACGEESDVAN